MSKTVDYLNIARRHLSKLRETGSEISEESEISPARWDGVLLHNCLRCGEHATNDELTLITTSDDDHYSAWFVHRRDCEACS